MQKFRELQEWKRSRPIDQIQQDQEYQRIAKRTAKIQKKSRGRGAAAKRRTVRGCSACGGSPGCDLFWGLAIPVCGKGEEMLLPVVPFVFGTVLCQFIMQAAALPQTE